MSELRDVVIDRLGRDGDGIAGDLRVAFSLPGERLRGAVEGGRMAAPVLLAASQARVAPPCRHFGACGGCQLQHADDAWLADWKRDVIVRALGARGLACAKIAPALTSPPRSRRRAVLAGVRGRKAVLVGFRRRRSERVEDIAECHVLRPEIVAAGPVLAALTRLGASRSRGVRLTVACGPAGLDVDVADGRALDGALRMRLAGLTAEAGLARLAWAGETLVQARPPVQRFGRAGVVPPPGAFLQATAEGEAALAGFVRAAVGNAARVADLFAGCGTFALPLAETAEVHAVEAEPAMLAALDAGWRRTPGLRRVSAEARDLFRRPLLATELARFDAVVFDPPRAGSEAQCRELARARVGTVVAVSCDPASFARDAAILAGGGYRLERVQPVDQFRWSGHVELAASFARDGLSG